MLYYTENMDIEYIISIVIDFIKTPAHWLYLVGGIFVFYLIAYLFDLFLEAIKPKPKESHVKCTRCKKHFPHNKRTIDAWRNNKKRFFCRSCHQKWLDEQNLRVSSYSEEHYTSSALDFSQPQKRGCLGSFVIIIALPILFYLIFI